VGTDIVNTLLKYSLIHIETVELLMKSCVKLHLLFVNIQCATAYSPHNADRRDPGLQKTSVF